MAEPMNTVNIKKVLIANRGEIAIRVIRTCREMGLRTVAVYSDADRSSLHVRYADEAFRVGPAPSVESYLVMGNIIEAARKCNADAIHPGYGFLSENSEFVNACNDAGLLFIGPSGESMKIMGDKTVARERMRAAGVPVISGSEGEVGSLPEAETLAAEIGYPVILKASAGGGGKGMRVVRAQKELPGAFRAAQSEAGSAFGNPAVYMEKYIDNPRHIEFQIFGDHHGNYVHLFERECSIQRRHQKIIEESPSPFLTSEMRRTMGETAVKVARASGYFNAGTVEFLVDKNRNFYFLEMNTRLQVEHPVTEFITGLDLVRLQIQVASGGKLPIVQDDLKQNGAAIECRIYAEDPENNFLPSPGTIIQYRAPGGPWVREDSGIYQGYEVPIFYDPLLTKLITWGRTRSEAIGRMERSLKEYRIVGIKTIIPFLQTVMNDEDFLNGDFDTHFIARKGFHVESKETETDLDGNLPFLAGIIRALERQKQAISSADNRRRAHNPWRTAARMDQMKGRL